MSVTTIIVITSKHEPTKEELGATSRAAFATAGEQGFEPLRLRAMSTSTDDDIRLEDRQRIAKWERNP